MRTDDRSRNEFFAPMKATALWSVLLLAGLPIVDLQASCSPQCIAHARRESGIYTNKVGRTRGAIDWFEQAFFLGDTRTHPGVGFVGLPLVLGAQPGINPKYGHVVYVERSREIVKGRSYRLSVSHANFDASCSVERIDAYYFPATKEIEFVAGYFGGQTFTVKGFITH